MDVKSKQIRKIPDRKNVLLDPVLKEVQIKSFSCRRFCIFILNLRPSLGKIDFEGNFYCPYFLIFEINAEIYGQYPVGICLFKSNNEYSRNLFEVKNRDSITRSKR